MNRRVANILGGAILGAIISFLVLYWYVISPCLETFKAR